MPDARPDWQHSAHMTIRPIAEYRMMPIPSSIRRSNAVLRSCLLEYSATKCNLVQEKLEDVLRVRVMDQPAIPFVGQPDFNLNESFEHARGPNYRWAARGEDI